MVMLVPCAKVPVIAPVLWMMVNCCPAVGVKLIKAPVRLPLRLTVPVTLRRSYCVPAVVPPISMSKAEEGSLKITLPLELSCPGLLPGAMVQFVLASIPPTVPLPPKRPTLARAAPTVPLTSAVPRVTVKRPDGLLPVSVSVPFPSLIKAPVPLVNVPLKVDDCPPELTRKLLVGPRVMLPLPDNAPTTLLKLLVSSKPSALMVTLEDWAMLLWLFRNTMALLAVPVPSPMTSGPGTETTPPPPETLPSDNVPSLTVVVPV